MRSCSLQTDPTHALPSEQVTAGRASFLSAVDCRREVGTDRVSLRDLRRGVNGMGMLRPLADSMIDLSMGLFCPRPLGSVLCATVQRVGKLRAPSRGYVPTLCGISAPSARRRRRRRTLLVCCHVISQDSLAVEPCVAVQLCW
jgi:hypothetical protein